MAARQPAGIPVGGQFASRDRADSELTLAPAGVPWDQARAAAIAAFEARPPYLTADEYHGWREAFINLPSMTTANPHEYADKIERSSAFTDGADGAYFEGARKRLRPVIEALRTAHVEHQYGVPLSGKSGRVGNWAVDVSHHEAVAQDTRTSLVYSARMTRFPAGWRVGKVWSPENPPLRVIALANKLAGKLP